MSILDTFYIVFESNADKVKQGAQEATDAGKKLQEQLNTTGQHGEHAAHTIKHANDSTTASFHHMREAADEMARGVVEKVAEIAAAFVALLGVEKLVENFFEQAHHTALLGEQARSLGVNVETLDAWGQAVLRVHGSTEAFTQSLITLGVNLARVDLGAGARSRKFFEEMGINIRGANGLVKSGFELIPELNRKFQDYAPAKSLAMGRGIGLDEGTIRLLQLNTHEFDEITKRVKELGIITKEDTEVAHHFNLAWLDVSQVMRSITVEADTAFLPIISKILHYVEEFILFMKEHKDFAAGLAIGITAALAMVTRGFWLLSAAMWSNPYLLIALGVAALIVLFALLYDDIKNFVEGHNSLIGEMIKKWPLLGKAVEEFIAILKTIKPILADIGTFGSDMLDKLIQGWKDFGTISEAIFMFMRDMISDPGNAGSNYRRRMSEISRRGGDPVADQTMSPEQKGFLETIAGPESGGKYNVRYNGRAGGATFDDFSKHPNIPELITSGPHKGETSTAAGKYQFLYSTWKELAAELGLKDFSPASQDKAAWHLAAKEFFRKKGYSLLAAVTEGGHEKDIADALHGQWDSLPGGGQPSGDMGTFKRRLLDGIGRAREYLQGTQSPLLAHTSNSIANSNVKNSLLNVGGITIQAPTAEPKDFVDSFMRHMNEHYESVMPNYADGISY